VKSHIKLGRIAGVELGLHYSWLVIAALITFSLAARFRFTNPEWGTTVIWVSAVVTGILFFVGLFVHELSHAMVAKSRGLPIHRITLFFLGGVAQIEREAENPGTEFWMAIAGPIASIVLGFLCLGVAHAVFGWQFWEMAQVPAAAILVWLGYINLVLAGFNLIPGFPMDGGRVLRAIIWWATGNGDKAMNIAARIGQFVGWLFVMWGIFRVFTGGGLGALWIALIGWFLIQAASASLYQAQASSALRGLKVRDVMEHDCGQVDANSSVQSFVDWYLMRADGRCFLVYEGDQMAGTVTLREVRKIDRESWPTTTLREIMQPVSAVPKVAPDMPLEEALERMAREDLDQLLVVSQAEVQGSISRSHILQVVRARTELNVA
jgi:Zn-dependent protease/predicted transcriptional regulator